MSQREYLQSLWMIPSWEVVSALKDRIKVQKDQDKLEKWPEVNRMKLSKENAKYYTYKRGITA